MSASPYVRHALADAAGRGVARLDAQMLLLHALGREPNDRAWLLAHDADALTPQALARFQDDCARRLAGEPVAYIVGHKEFHGLRLAVDARVLVPRPDTETLVEWALEVLQGQASPAVVDLGTGSGAIALALARARPDARVTAVDASLDALAVARANAQSHGLDIRWVHGDWFTGLDDGPFDLVVSNPPYIAAGDPHLPSLRHEPISALASGADGLDDLRRIVAAAPARLAPGAWLLLEHGWDQAGAVRGLLEAAGLAEIASRADLAGIARCTGARRPTDG